MPDLKVKNMELIVCAQALLLQLGVKGKPDHQIMSQTGHSSAVMLDLYTRLNTLVARNSSDKDLGL